MFSPSGELDIIATIAILKIYDLNAPHLVQTHGIWNLNCGFQKERLLNINEFGHSQEV